MKKHGPAVTAATITTLLLIAGCGDGQGTTTSKPSTSASSAPVSAPKTPSPHAKDAAASEHAKTKAEVRSDLRFAARAVPGELTVKGYPPELDCPVHATVLNAIVLSQDLPDEADLRRVVDRLRTRGWKLDGEISTDGGTFLDAGDKWSLIAGVGPAPDKAYEEATPDMNALLLSTTGLCDGE